MKSYNIHEAKTKFSSILARVAMGEKITISKAGSPIAMLVPYQSLQPKKQRKPGLFLGQIKIAEDFNDPLDEDFMNHF
jgi:prevent-host-death family protein